MFKQKLSVHRKPQSEAKAQIENNLAPDFKNFLEIKKKYLEGRNLTLDEMTVI